MQFKKGDVVKLVDNKLLGAPVGSLAVVVKVYSTAESIDVRWIPSQAHQQMDGGYAAKRFVNYCTEQTVEDTRSYLEAVTM